jgi:hypothetical protein
MLTGSHPVLQPVAHALDARSEFRNPRRLVSDRRVTGPRGIGNELKNFIVPGCV